MKGSTIRFRADIIPPLTGGTLTIEGDIDGDRIPDVTLDGSQAKQGFVLRSSGNTVTHLRLINFKDATFRFACTVDPCQPSLIRSNRIVENVIETTGIMAIEVGAQGLLRVDILYRDLAWEDTEIIGNTITAGPNTEHIDLRPGANGGSRNRISRITISGNRLTGGSVGINLHAGDETSIERGGPPPIRYSEDNLIEDATISDNVLTGATYQSIILQAANTGNRGNRIVRTLISGNTIRGTEYPIFLNAGTGTGTDGSDQPRSTSANAVTDVEVRENVIEPIDHRAGMVVSAAGKPGAYRAVPVTENRIERVAIRDNVVTIRVPGVAGIRVQAGAVYGPERVALNIVTDVTIAANRISAAPALRATGIEVLAGWIAVGEGTAQQNEVRNVVVRENVIGGTFIPIALAGGRKARATGNVIAGYAIEGNDLGGAQPRIAPDEEGASGNSVR